MKKDLDITKPRSSEQILPVPWHFVISRFHCGQIENQDTGKAKLKLKICNIRKRKVFKINSYG